MPLDELAVMTGRRSQRWMRARGLPWLLVPELQRLLDDAWQLEIDQTAGGCGDPVEDELLRRLASDLLDAAVVAARLLQHRAFVAR